MARPLARFFPVITAALNQTTVGVPKMPSFLSQRRAFHTTYLYFQHPRPSNAFFAAVVRGFRNVRWREAVRKRVPEEKKVEFRVNVSVEEGMSDDHEIVNIVEMLKLDAPMAMKMAFDSLKELKFRPQTLLQRISANMRRLSCPYCFATMSGFQTILKNGKDLIA